MKKSIIVAVVMITLAVIIFSPVIVFAVGYFGGMILDFAVGETVVNALNVMFDTTRFSRENLPMLCGVLTVIGSCFKATHISIKNNKQ